jgi:uncharacterized protein
MMPVVTQIYFYPVKSMRCIPLETATLTIRGLEFDRNWMVVTEDGTFITQRDLPALATLRTEISGEELRFTGGGGSTFTVSLHGNGGHEIVTEVWGDRCEAVDEGDDVSEWLTKQLGMFKQKALRLVKFKENFRREVEEDFLKGESAHTAFADGYPFLVTAEESLSMLNDRLVSTGAYPVTMDRFRPNIVIKGLEPFQENAIGRLITADGSIEFGLRKPCRRCKVTTVDQESGTIAEPKEPLRTLSRMNTVPGHHGAYFGQNATLLAGHGMEIRRGDVLEVVS